MYFHPNGIVWNWSNVFRKAGANYNIQMIFYWNENILKWSDAMGDNDSCHTDFEHLFCFRWHHSDSWWNRYLPSGQSSREVQVCLHLSFLREIEKCPHLLLIVYGRVDNRWLARNTSLQNFFFKHIGNQKCFGCQIRSIRINYSFPSIDVVSY